jgi:hypothetical protein
VALQTSRENADCVSPVNNEPPEKYESLSEALLVEEQTMEVV